MLPPAPEPNKPPPNPPPIDSIFCWSIWIRDIVCWWFVETVVFNLLNMSAFSFWPWLTELLMSVNLPVLIWSSCCATPRIPCIPWIKDSRVDEFCWLMALTFALTLWNPWFSVDIKSPIPKPPAAGMIVSLLFAMTRSLPGGFIFISFEMASPSPPAYLVGHRAETPPTVIIGPVGWGVAAGWGNPVIGGKGNDSGAPGIIGRPDMNGLPPGREAITDNKEIICPSWEPIVWMVTFCKSMETLTFFEASVAALVWVICCAAFWLSCWVLTAVALIGFITGVIPEPWVLSLRSLWRVSLPLEAVSVSQILSFFVGIMAGTVTRVPGFVPKALRAASTRVWFGVGFGVKLGVGPGGLTGVTATGLAGVPTVGEAGCFEVAFCPLSRFSSSYNSFNLFSKIKYLSEEGAFPDLTFFSHSFCCSAVPFKGRVSSDFIELLTPAIWSLRDLKSRRFWSSAVLVLLSCEVVSRAFLSSGVNPSVFSLMLRYAS